MLKFFNSKILLDLAFPKFCFGCQKEGFYLCQDCRSLLDICEFDYCLCQSPVKIFPNPESLKEAKCHSCRGKKLSGLYFALPFKEKSLARKLVHQFKYAPYVKDLGQTLASLLIEQFIKTKKTADAIWQDSVLVPVPSDKKKLRERGYNQSEELAKELAKILKIPVVSNVLLKIKSTPAQMELKKEEREKNLSNAFAISRHRCEEGNSPTKQSIADKKIFLVDDVYTTGSTMEACAQVLKQAGAKQVWGIALSREEWLP